MAPKTKITKEEILCAGLMIAKTEGIGAVTARSIAQKLKCSTQPVYWVFGTMENLYRELVAEAMKEYDRYLLTEVKGVTKYQSIGLNYVRFAKEQPELFRLLFMTNRQTDTAIFDSDLDPNRDYILSLIENEYGLAGEAVNDMYVTMWLFCHGIAAMIVTKTVKLDERAIARLMKSVFINVLKGLKETKA